MSRMTTKYQTPTHRLAFQPVAYRSIQQGINKLANAIRPTLGPQPRLVAIEHAFDDRMPELLDNGAIIAKRIIQLPGWGEDVGAMFLRDALWRLHNQIGDGTATAAVLFQFVFNESIRYIAAGGNAMRLRMALDKGVAIILDQLASMTVPVSGEENLALVAKTVCSDPVLSEFIGEIFDIIGEYGRLEIRQGRGREAEREYVEGMYWERGVASREMLNDPGLSKIEFEDAAILISDLDIEEPQQLFPPLELAISAGLPALLIIVNKISDRAIGFLLANKNPEKFQAVVVRTPGTARHEKLDALQDLAVLTGGRPFIKQAGETFVSIKMDDFGHARRVWADLRNFGVIGGKGNPRALRQHIANLRTAYRAADEIAARERALKRIGKLLGGSATLWIGGTTELQLEERMEIARRTAAVVRGAMLEGVVPGGGVALLSCRPALQRAFEDSNDLDERAAYRILIDAMAEPLRVIAANAGFDHRKIVAQIALSGSGYGLDATSGQIVPVMDTGILDAATMQKSAAYVSISSAALALTIDVLVHRKPENGLQPVQGPGKRKQL